MTSLEYWVQREAKHRAENHRAEERYRREIDRIYRDMLDGIQADIDGFYARYAEREGITLAVAKKRVQRADVNRYARKAKKYVRERNFSKKANREMRLYNLTMKVNRLELLKAEIGLNLVGGFDELSELFDRRITDRTMEEMRYQAGILGKSISDQNPKAAETIVQSSFHNATFSDRIWMHQDLLRQEIGKQLAVGLIQGKSSRVLAANIRKRFNVSRSDAERLMTTELRRVQTDVAKATYEKNGNEEYQYLTANAMGPCEVCKALDGKHFKVSEMQIGVNAPPMHPRCHCTTAPYWDQEKFDRWLDEQNREKNGQSSGMTPSNKSGSVRMRKTISFTESAIEKELRKAQEEFASLNHEENLTVTADGKVWRVVGTAGAVNPWIIEKHGSSLAGAYSYHNHPPQETHYSFSADDVRYFFDAKQKYSKASDDVYEYEMRRTAKTIDVDGEKIYNEFKKIYRDEVYALAWGGEIDIDKDGFHETMHRLGEKYRFVYERRSRK